MKTAISVDDELLAAADRTAKALRTSRSGLFSLAMKEYLERRRDEEILDQLNRAYATPDASERQIAARMKTRFRNSVEGRW